MLDRIFSHLNLARDRPTASSRVVRSSQQTPSFNHTSLSHRKGQWLQHLRRTVFSADVLAPVIVGVLALVIWQVAVWMTQVPPYLLPGPILVGQTLVTEWGQLFPSLMVTLKITVTAFLAAVISGLLIAILFAQSKWIERSFFPYAVILQTTPIVAIAPLIIIWTSS